MLDGRAESFIFSNQNKLVWAFRKLPGVQKEIRSSCSEGATFVVRDVIVLVDAGGVSRKAVVPISILSQDIE